MNQLLKKKNVLRVKNYLMRNPWAKTKLRIHNRCTDIKHHYFKKGIKDLLSTSDLKLLWFRDKAYDLIKPSIDRIDSSKDYTLDNCRFIELGDNHRPTRILDNCPLCTRKNIKHKAKGLCGVCYRRERIKNKALSLTTSH